jgi:hypothetical protein
MLRFHGASRRVPEEELGNVPNITPNQSTKTVLLRSTTTPIMMIF